MRTMTVIKRKEKLDTTPVPCSITGSLKYEILDIAIFQRISVNVPQQKNMVAYAVYDGGIKLCEAETSFSGVDSENMHVSISKAINKDFTRLNLLKETKGELFDVLE